MIRHLDLFSGIGGWSLAARWTGRIQTIGFCEIEPFPQRVLAKNFPGVPIHDDIRTLTPGIVADWGGCDLITASYPCQPFSTAGQRRGADDDRNLWPEVARLVAGLRPRWLLAENVVGHIRLGLDDVLNDLEGLGYTTGADVIPACAVGARHRRERVWIFAYTPGQRLPGPGEPVQSQHPAPDCHRKTTEPLYGRQGPAWPPEPREGWVVDGVPGELDEARLMAFGNAIVPQVAYQVLEYLLIADPAPDAGQEVG